MVLRSEAFGWWMCHRSSNPPGGPCSLGFELPDSRECEQPALFARAAIAKFRSTGGGFRDCPTRPLHWRERTACLLVEAASRTGRCDLWNFLRNRGRREILQRQWIILRVHR